MFTAKYIPRVANSQLPVYYYTITNADDLSEATKIADRYTKKGYICAKIILANCKKI